MPLPRRWLQPLYSRVITSPVTRRLWRAGHDWLSRATRQAPVLTLWAGFDDPESFLLVQSLPPLLEHYALSLEVNLTPPRAPVTGLDIQNAWHLAQQHQLSFHALTPPHPADCRLAERILMASAGMPPADRLCLLRQLFVCVWEHQAGKLETLALRFPPVSHDEALQTLQTWSEANSHDTESRTKTRLVYQGETFIGLDDLPELAERLEESSPNLPNANPELTTGFSPGSGFLVNDPEMLAGIRSHRYCLDFYFCFRDPYSYLNLDDVIALSDHYGLRLRLLPVTLPDGGASSPALLPPAGLLWRSARRAARRRQPFGEVCMPDPSGIRHCHALLAYAAGHGRERQMTRSLLQGIWAGGRDLTCKPHRASVLRQSGFSTTEPEAIPPADATLHKAHEALIRLGLACVPALVLHAGSTLALCGSDRLGALDMAVADTLDNKNTE